jgi:hypothetical protein
MVPCFLFPSTLSGTMNLDALLPNVIPLRMIAFQLLFLLVAIAIEANIIHQRLDKPPKISAFFSATINLFSTTVGWLVLFIFLGIVANVSTPLLLEIKDALVSFIFFDRWLNGTAQLLIIIGIITFFATLGVEWVGFKALDWFEKLPTSQPKKPASPPPTLPSRSESTGVFIDRNRIQRALPPEVSTLIIANAWSYGAITLILLLQMGL